MGDAVGQNTEIKKWNGKQNFQWKLKRKEKN